MCDRILYLFLLMLSLASCKESEKEKALRLVSEWDGKEILFPDNSVFTIQGKDTVEFDFKNAEYKVVTYVDTIGCTSCKLQLHLWKALIEEVDSLTGGSVPFVFHFHPKDRKELQFLFRRDKFDYPVCLDEHDELNKLNAFPPDMTFQTFLLDAENKVKIIGNPILNPNVKNLFLKQLTGIDRQTESLQTEVSLSETEYDFGSFPKDEIQEHTFLLTNKGSHPLVILHAVTSCGCTRVEYDKTPVPPSGVAKVKVIYEAEQSGHFNKKITLHCNSENSPLILKVRGETKQ